MKVAVTGATGTIGTALVRALRDRGDDVTILSRSAVRAREKLGDVEVVEWREPKAEPAPAEALAGRDAVVNLLGEPLDKRWTGSVKREIEDSRVLGTGNLVAGLRSAEPRPRVFVSQSATGRYGARGDEPVTENEPAAEDFLARVTVKWEAEARAAEELGMRVALARTGVVLAAEGGAIKSMLLPFKLGLGGPVAGGAQYMPWIHIDDEVGALLHLLETDSASGPFNLSAPEPATNREFSKALGRVLRRPAVLPMPGVALRVLFGEMGSAVSEGVRAVPRRLQEAGYEFSRPDLEDALRDVVA